MDLVMSEEFDAIREKFYECEGRCCFYSTSAEYVCYQLSQDLKHMLNY